MKNNLLKNIKTNLKQTWYKQNFIVLMIGLFLFTSLSIGYSILSQNLYISGEVVLRTEKDIRVTGITSTITDCGYDIYNPKFNEDSITVNLNLHHLECTIKYQVTVTNNGTKPMELISIINENYNNDKIIYLIDGYKIGDVLEPNESITFSILFKYNSSIIQIPDNTDLGATIKFVWQEYISGGEEIEFKDFVYNGECEEYIIPRTGLYILEVWGAQGGSGGIGEKAKNLEGGLGGYSKGTVKLTKGEKIFICVGGQGNSEMGSAYIVGGFGGGGSVPLNSTSSSNYYHGSGGGGTDIRIGTNSLYSRIIVAGGGGGASGSPSSTYANVGGAGGGLSGQKPPNSYDRISGAGGTQTAGGIYGCMNGDNCGTSGDFGIGGSNGTRNNAYGSGAGGGGWYGGGGGSAGGASGGGGSGFVLTSSTVANTPTSYTLESQYYLSNAETVDGTSSMPTHDKANTMIGNPGNGHARISTIQIIDIEPPVISEIANKPKTFFITQTNNIDLSSYATAFDNEDDDITDNIKITSSPEFNKNKPGIYEITYKVKDSSGNSAKSFIITIEIWNFVKIVNGQYHSIALGSNGSVWTWGYNSVGQRGLGNTTSASSYRAPTQIPQSYFNDLPVIDIAAGYSSSFAINSDGQAYSWGEGASYQLGNGSTSNQTRPIAISQPAGIKFLQISSFYQTGAALGNDGNIYTWGLNTYGSTGNGDSGNKSVPSTITSSGNFSYVDQGYYGGAAVNNSGQVYVWGTNLEGELGIGNTSGYYHLPTLVPNLKNIKQISYGARHILALTNDGEVYSWGSNGSGRLGHGDTTTRSTPILIDGLSNVSQVNAGYDFSQFKVGNNIYSSGYADYGELFVGNTTIRQTPYLSPLNNVTDNVGFITGKYDNAFILSANGSTVYGIGFCDATGQEFGSKSVQSTSNSSAVPWSFTPPDPY